MAVVVEEMCEQTTRGCKTLVVGLGKTGLSCARYLTRRGAEVAVTDTRVAPPELETARQELPEMPLFLGGFSESAFARAEQIVVSPGVSRKHPLIEAAGTRGVEVIGDVELFARAALAPVIAVTGSNGKSTVTTWVGEMARAAGRTTRVGGNLGTPALEILQDEEPDLYVLELSSFQLETTWSLAPAAAAVLNLSPDHLDRYASVAEYAAAKQRIFRHAAVQVVNADDRLASSLVDAGRPVRRFTLAEPGGEEYGIAEHAGSEWLMRGAQPVLPVNALRIPGRHNVANALAALALGDAAGLPEAAMVRALRSFHGLPHRMQWVAEFNEVTWYNDSKGTNPGATCAAASGLRQPLVLLAGGDGKGADFSPLRDALAGKARAVILFGRDAPLIESALKGVVPVRHAASLQEAVRLASRTAEPGDAVLLSPACASFDMFSGYEQRGQVFMDAVRGLANG
jgi:UDP-N-acetylmuramoylalanine--D-glutamate ligase